MTALCGELVVLRALDERDARRIHTWHNDATLYRSMLGDFYGPTLEETETWLAARCAAHGGDELSYAICMREDGEHIGNLYLRDIDRAAGTAQFHGLFLAAPADRSRGLGREATKIAMRHAIDEVGLRRIWGLMLADNASSLRAMQGAGFRVEQHLPAHVTKDGRPRDVIRIVLTAPVEAS